MSRRRLALAAMLIGGVVTATSHATPDPHYLRTVGQWGGTVRTTAVDGDLMYVGCGPRVLMVDMSDIWRLVQIGRTEILPGLVQTIAVSDGIMYVGGTFTGVAVYDVAEPGDPVRLGGFGAAVPCLALVVDETIAYVGEQDRLAVYDISVPTAAVLLGHCPLSGTVQQIALSGTVAYVAAAAGGTHVVDISNPAAPVRIGGCTTAGQPSGVAVLGDVLCVTHPASGPEFFDVSNPATPVWRGSYPYDEPMERAALRGSYAFLPTHYDDLCVLDISDLTAPRLVAWAETRGHGRDVCLSGNLAIVATDFGGVQIVQVDNPLLPRRAGRLDTGGQFLGLAVGEQRGYVGDMGSRVHVVDLANPAEPQRLGTASTANQWSVALTLDGDYVYAATFSRGFGVIDVSNPALPRHVAGVHLGDLSYGVAKWENYAFVTYYQIGMQVFDVSVPASPRWVGEFGTPGTVKRLAVRDGYAYLADEVGGLRIVDVSDPSMPVEVGTLATMVPTHGLALAYPFVYMMRLNQVDVIDVSDPTAPLWVNQASTYFTADAIAINDRWMAISTIPGMLNLYDITQPTTPRRVALVPLPIDAWNLAIDGAFVYVADIDGGLVVLRMGIRGDANCDGAVDTADIDAFVQAIADPSMYTAFQPGCDVELCDTNGDGAVDTGDIDAFVALLVGG